MVAGPAGTGKSRANLEKIHYWCERVPGTRCLLIRKTRASLSESALVTFEEKVVPVGHPILQGARRHYRQAYQYPNGSEIALGGMDKASRVMSTEYDFVYVMEAIELDEAEWEALTTRLRNGKLPFQQLLADTNPDSPRHWLKRRCDVGKSLLLESRHEDNPVLWDAEAEAWTSAGQTYLAKLDALTGPRKLRLRYGRWVQAEGVVYEGWDAAIHVVNRFDIPGNWPRILTVDFGYTNPFVCQWWALDGDNRLYRYREIYKTRTLVEDHAKRIKYLCGHEPAPIAVICDHDAEDRATLERHLGWETTPAIKDKSPGIQAVASRLRPAGDGKPRVFFLRDSLDERDPNLADAMKPCCTEEEFDGYIWQLGGGRKKGEEPVKENDHGCVVAGTLVETRTGPQPVESIWRGDYVLTREGYRRVLAAGCTHRAARVCTVIFSDGRTLTGTANHPVHINGTDFVRMDALRYNDSVTDVSENPKCVACSVTHDLRPCRPTQNGIAPCVVLTRIERSRPCPVYNLQVDDAHEFYANGVLVHNCDALRYTVMALDSAPDESDGDDDGVTSLEVG